MKIFVINLARSRERREKMQAQLDALGLEFEWLDAVDGPALSPAELARHYDSKAARKRLSRDMSPGEIGCALSHCRAYQQILSDGLDEAIVLEDDLELGSDFAELVRGGQLSRSPKDLVLLFGQTLTLRAGALALPGTPFHLRRMLRMPFGGCAYYLKSSAARRLVQAAHPVRYLADWPASIHLWSSSAIIHPFPISTVLPEFDSTSTLHQERTHYRAHHRTNADLQPRSFWHRLMSWMVIPSLLCPRSYGPLNPVLDRLLMWIKQLGIRLQVLEDVGPRLPDDYVIELI